VSPRAGLNRAAVVEAAAALADEGGLEDLSLADLAERLGVRKPSLYNHVAGIGDLKRGLALVGLRELGRRLSRAAAGKAGDEGLFALAEAYRRFVKQRPGLYEATVRSYRISDPENPELGAAEEEAMGTVLAVLASCGVRGEEEAIHAARGLRSIAHGFATLEKAGGFGMSLDPDESFRKLMRAFAAGLRSGEARMSAGSADCKEAEPA
jgi:AcrR family transcriptional regulator